MSQRRESVVDQVRLVDYPIDLVSQWGFPDTTIPRGLGCRQHKQNAVITWKIHVITAFSLGEKILDIAIEASFSFIGYGMTIGTYIYEKVL